MGVYSTLNVSRKAAKQKLNDLIIDIDDNHLAKILSVLLCNTLYNFTITDHEENDDDTLERLEK